MTPDHTPRLASRAEQLDALIAVIQPGEEVTSFQVAERIGRTRLAILEDLFRLEAANRLESRVPAERNHPGSPVRLWRLP